jgi:hypothetical protein
VQSKSIADIESIETHLSKSSFLCKSFDLRFKMADFTTVSSSYNYVQSYAPAYYSFSRASKF